MNKAVSQTPARAIVFCLTNLIFLGSSKKKKWSELNEKKIFLKYSAWWEYTFLWFQKEFNLIKHQD